MATKISYNLNLSPAELLERLRTETVAYESILSVNAPLQGYVTFVQESVTGEKTVVSRITGNRFILMPVGIWPVKGKSLLASVGSMHGWVDPLESGSSLSTQFRIFPINLVFIIGMSALSTLFVSAMILLTLSNVQMDVGGFILLWCLTGATCGVTLYMALYVWLGARNQENLLRKFLEEFVAEFSK